MKFVSSALIAVLAIGSAAHAATDKNYCGSEIKSENCKNIPGNRRAEVGGQVTGGNPVAVALDKGNLFVFYTTGDSAKLKKCQVTSNVSSFKLSQNPGDVAMAYFIQKDQLMDLRMHGAVSKAECPKKNVVNMNEQSGFGGDILEFALFSDSNAVHVGIAKTTNGVFAWTDKNFSPLYRSQSQSVNDQIYQAYKGVVK